MKKSVSASCDNTSSLGPVREQSSLSRDIAAQLGGFQDPPTRRGHDTVGNPHRAQNYQFEFFEPILLLKSDKQLPVEQFEATVSQSTVPSPLLTKVLG